jgi:hypothetical protein
MKNKQKEDKCCDLKLTWDKAAKKEKITSTSRCPTPDTVQV